MKIRRPALPSDNFTLVPNQWLRDTSISHKARGLLILLASHDPGFEVETKSLETVRDGREAVSSACKELEDRGYLSRTRQRNPDGSLGSYLYDLIDPFA